MADEQMKKTVGVSDIMGGAKSPKPKSSKPSDSKGKKTKHKHTHIEHHDDGSHTVHHTPQGGGEETSYTAPDFDAVHDGLEQHVGDANAAAPDAGAMPQGGAPDAGAQPDPNAPAAGGAPQQPTPGA